MRVTLFFIACLFYGVVSFGQSLKALNDSILKYKLSYPVKAIDFGYKALKIESKEITYDVLNTYYLIGECFYYLEIYEQSFDFLSKSLELYSQMDPKYRKAPKIVKPPWILALIASGFLKNKNYEKARKYYNESIYNFSLFGDDNPDKIFGTNVALSNLALVEIELKNFQEAERLLNLVIEQRLTMGNKLHLIVSYWYFMDLYLEMENESLAKEYYQKIILETSKITSKSNNINSIEALQVLSKANKTYGDYFKAKKRYDDAIIYFELAKNFLVDNHYQIPKLEIEIANCNIELNREEIALAGIKKVFDNFEISELDKLKAFKLMESVYKSKGQMLEIVQIKDSIIKLHEELISLTSLNKFVSIENLMVLSEKQNEIRLTETKNNRIIFLSATIVLTLLILISFLRINYNLQKEKSERLKLKKENINNELKLKKRELISKVNFISYRNDYIKKILNQFDENHMDINQKLNGIKFEIKNIANSEKVYEEFDRMFVQVYPKFFHKINSIAKLSQTDLRLASFIKMNHSIDKISRISGISKRTVESQRYRLAKKLKLQKGQDLNSFINQL